MTDKDLYRYIFFPHRTERAADVVASRRRFVYYTSAETALRVLKNKEIWLRNALTMNDFMEVEHGFECLNSAYKGEPGERLQKALDACHEGLAQELLDHFNAWLPGIRHDTYIACVSEHLPDEDKSGRLSMWRAYGGSNGVAIVINGDVMFGEGTALGAFSSPCAYWTPEQMGAELTRIAARISEHKAYVAGLERSKVKGTLFEMYRFAVLSTKHPGFSEEREWRVIASPLIHTDSLLTSAVETIRGVPQIVQKLHFENHPDKGLVGLALPDLLHRVIIGPCEFPLVIRRAIHEVLLGSGIEAPGDRIFVSDIPLRQA